MINGIEGFLKGTILDFEEALPGEKLEYLTYTPGAYLGSCRYKLPESLEDPIFNVFTTVVLFPFIRGLEKLAYLTIPESDEEKSAKEDVFAILDERFVSSPAFAI